MSDAPISVLTDGQVTALQQLRELALESDAFELIGDPEVEGDGRLRVELSLDCSQTPTSETGLPLRPRERLLIRIPGNFPYGQVPEVSTPHLRWQGVPHVQWGRVVCLYASPSTEWNPADGMLGLVRRLVLWLRRAAEGQLDPDDMPLHPPVAYVTAGTGLTVVRADIGSLAPAPEAAPRTSRPSVRQPPGDAASSGEPAMRLVVALCRRIQPGRFDVVQWLDYEEWFARTSPTSPTSVAGEDFGVLAVLSPREFTFEYPRSIAGVFAGLETLGISRPDVMVPMAVVAWAYRHHLGLEQQDQFPQPIHLFLGTPSRRLVDGHLKQHLVCWSLDDMGRHLVSRLTQLLAGAEMSRDILSQLVADIDSWAWNQTARWVSVQEARPEVTIRRDEDTAAAWLRGKRVLVLGAGALGGLVSEWVVRAGASHVEIVDNDHVSPGILVRQPYSDDEIGHPKSTTLAARLQRIHPGQNINGVFHDAIDWCLHGLGPPAGIHLVVDATANASVSSALERARAKDREAWPPVVSIAIGHEAERGVVTVAKPGATGAGRDILRRLALKCRTENDGPLARLTEDIFPLVPLERPFQPEPGCSSPTFRGSAMQLAALAGHLFDAAVRVVAGTAPPEGLRPMVAACVTLDGPDPAAGTTWLGWKNDHVVTDDAHQYEVRVSSAALTTIRAECRRGARVRPPDFETGGSLFGEIDEAIGCVWVDTASGPPPDSWLSPLHFEHGTVGVQELVDYHRTRSGSLSSYLGIWHSHPDGPARPSPTDEASMDIVVSPALGEVRRAVFLIVGGEGELWKKWLDSGDSGSLFAHVSKRSGAKEDRKVPPLPEGHRKVAVRGGWSPAIAERSTARRRRWLVHFPHRRRRRQPSRHGR